MKIFISADIEGVTGTTDWDETNLEKEASQIFCQQMTAEVAAACDAALLAGATEIWVKDAHWTGRNLLAAKLPHEARLIRSWAPHPLMMVEGLDQSFQAALFIGYHSRAGAASSPLAHTMTGKFASVKINDRYASEFLIHAYAASNLGAPVVFISGDRGICQEASEVVPQIRSVAVKEGIGASTVNIHPEQATYQIGEGVYEALHGDLSACQLSLPDHFTVKVQYKEHVEAYKSGFYPGAQLLDPYTVQFECQDYFDVLRFFLFVS